jgi:hypothetical protein
MCFSGAHIAILVPVLPEVLEAARVRVCRNAECVVLDLPRPETQPGAAFYSSPHDDARVPWIHVSLQPEPDGTYVRIDWNTLHFENLLPGDEYRTEIATKDGKIVATRAHRAKTYTQRTLNGDCGPTCRSVTFADD